MKTEPLSHWIQAYWSLLAGLWNGLCPKWRAETRLRQKKPSILCVSWRDVISALLAFHHSLSPDQSRPGLINTQRGHTVSSTSDAGHELTGEKRDYSGFSISVAKQIWTACLIKTNCLCTPPWYLVTCISLVFVLLFPLACLLHRTAWLLPTDHRCRHGRQKISWRNSVWTKWPDYRTKPIPKTPVVWAVVLRLTQHRLPQ